MIINRIIAIIPGMKDTRSVKLTVATGVKLTKDKQEEPRKEA